MAAKSMPGHEDVTMQPVGGGDGHGFAREHRAAIASTNEGD